MRHDVFTMPLKITVSDLKELPENVRGAYRQREGSNDFALDLDSELVAAPELKALVSERDTLKSKLETVLIAQQATRVASELGAHAGAIDDVISRVRSRFKLGENGDVVAVDASGNPAYGEDGNMLTVAGVVHQLTKSAPHLFAQRTREGAGAGGRSAPGSNPWGKATWSVTEQMRLVRSNPDEAKRLAAEAGHKI